VDLIEPQQQSTLLIIEIPVRLTETAHDDAVADSEKRREKEKNINEPALTENS